MTWQLCLSPSHPRCDWQDGRWKNNGVNHKCNANTGLISISCSGGKSGSTKGHANKATDSKSVNIMGTAKDSGQVTTCDNGKEHVGSVVRCNGPRVTWGSHTGVPHKHSANKYDAYCQSLGFAKFVPGSDKYGTVRCTKGALFWCKGYDFNSGYHWWVVRPCFARWRRMHYFSTPTTALH